MKKNIFRSKLSPAFIILSIAIVYFGNFWQFLIYAVVVAVHEFAHFFVAKKLGYTLGKFYVMPYGVCLNYKDNILANDDEIIIAIAGPAINFLLCFVSVSLWWMFPITYYYLDYFCFCNLVLGLFNILPCFPLDGGRVFMSILSKKYDREKVIKICVWLNYILSGVLCILFVTSFFSAVNYTYIVLAIFLFSGSINPNKYSSYNYLSLGVNRKRLLKNGANIKILAVPSSMPVYKIMAKFSRFKFNIVYIVFSNNKVKVLSENAVSELALKFSPAYSFDEIGLFV